MLARLPVDISTFRELRETGYLYVDKTKEAHGLITGGRRFFLSRPRRFGKSLLVSMMKEMLLGNKELFKGLWVYESDYQWEKHGVVALDFSMLSIESVDIFRQALCRLLLDVAQEYEILLDTTIQTPEFLLQDLIGALYKRFGKVSVLIDEYDNPILHTLNDHTKATAIRDLLRSFFTSIKALDAKVQFAFITGVSSFAKAGLFSGMNNLQIVTLDKRCTQICGYTDDEIDHYLTGHIQAWATAVNKSSAEMREKMREWYNGYHFGNPTTAAAIYNPFSVMLALATQSFGNFWFQSGAPTFLIEELKKEQRKEEYRLLNPEAFKASESTLGIFEIGATPLPALMFQTGYLTIASYDAERRLFTLAYPNEEVRSALQVHLLSIFANVDFTEAERVTANYVAGNLL